MTKHPGGDEPDVASMPPDGTPVPFRRGACHPALHPGAPITIERGATSLHTPHRAVPDRLHPLTVGGKTIPVGVSLGVVAALLPAGRRRQPAAPTH